MQKVLRRSKQGESVESVSAIETPSPLYEPESERFEREPSWRHGQKTHQADSPKLPVETASKLGAKSGAVYGDQRTAEGVNAEGSPVLNKMFRRAAHLVININRLRLQSSDDDIGGDAPKNIMRKSHLSLDSLHIHDEHDDRIHGVDTAKITAKMETKIETTILQQIWDSINLDPSNGLHRHEMKELLTQLDSGSTVGAEALPVDEILHELSFDDKSEETKLISFSQFKVWYFGGQSYATYEHLQQYRLRPWSTIVPEFLTLATKKSLLDVGDEKAWTKGHREKLDDKHSDAIKHVHGFALWTDTHDHMDLPRAARLVARNQESLAYVRNSNLIDPDGNFRQIWDVMQVFLLFYLAVMTPYQIAFDAPDPKLWSLEFWLTAAMDSYFMVDLYCSFVTAYYDASGELVVKKSIIYRHYLKSWFCIDLISCLPFGYVIYTVEEVDSDIGHADHAKHMRMLKLTRLLKLLRLARLRRLLDKYDAQFYALMQRLRILKLVAYIGLSAHWLCCMWYFVGTLDSVMPTADGFAIGWVKTYFGEATVAPGQRYWLSLFHSVTALVAGGLPATTKIEVVFGSAAIVFGSFVVGIIIANLTTLITQASFESSLPKQIQAISNALCRACFPANKALTQKVLNYFSEYHKHRPAIEETDFLDLMPGELFYEIATEIGWAPKLDTQTNENSRDMLAKIPFFRGLDAYSKVQICGELKILTVGKLKKDGRPQSRADATIIREGQVGTDMFVIIEGLVAVEIEEKRLGFLGQHHFFGELAALLPPEPGSWGRPHHRTHYAVEDCTLGVLSHEDMMKLRGKRLEIDKAGSPFVAEALRCTR